MMILPDIYVLRAEPRGLIVFADGRVSGPLRERLRTLPPEPIGFEPKLGSYRSISDEARRLNQEQIDRKCWDYLYSPDIHGSLKAPTTLDVED